MFYDRCWFRLSLR